MTIRTTHQLIRAIATAINESDLDTLNDCKAINADWLQPADEFEAMQELIDAAIESVWANNCGE